LAAYVEVDEKGRISNYNGKERRIKMEFETLKKSHKKEILIVTVVFILIAIVLIVRASFAKYQTTKNVTIAEGTVNYKVPDFKIMAMYKNDGAEDVEITTMPESGYTINESKSYCNLNGSKDSNAKLYTDENGNHVISKLTKGDRCYIYFDKSLCSGSACKTILGNVTVNDGTPDFSKVATTDEGVFKAKDDNGDTYYWRGTVTNNYVKFAGKYWRIIRINGDGTIRMIYDGTTARMNGTAFTADTSAFNADYDKHMSVGFRYTNGEVHGLDTESTILQKLNTWYTTNLSSYADKIDTNAGFCGDRTPSTNDITSNGEGGTGTTATYYGAYLRLVNDTKTPVLTCSSEDIYTVTEANKGNKSLTNPIGLVTADEVSMAGGAYGADNSNSAYYLFTLNYFYWTISPYNYDVGGAYVFGVCREGHLCNARVYGPGVMGTVSVRPVINLQSDIKLTGSGTMSDPYVVV